MNINLRPRKIIRAFVIGGLVILPTVPGVKISLPVGGVLALFAGAIYLYDAYKSAQKIEGAHELIRKLRKGELTLEGIQAGEDGLTIEDEAGNSTTI